MHISKVSNGPSYWVDLGNADRLMTLKRLLKEGGIFNMANQACGWIHSKNSYQRVKGYLLHMDGEERVMRISMLYTD